VRKHHMYSHLCMWEERGSGQLALPLCVLRASPLVGHCVAPTGQHQKARHAGAGNVLPPCTGATHALAQHTHTHAHTTYARTHAGHGAGVRAARPGARRAEGGPERAAAAAGADGGAQGDAGALAGRARGPAAGPGVPQGGGQRHAAHHHHQRGGAVTRVCVCVWPAAGWGGGAGCV